MNFQHVDVYDRAFDNLPSWGSTKMADDKALPTNRYHHVYYYILYLHATVRQTPTYTALHSA